MALTATIQQAIESAFSGLGDLVSDVVLVKIDTKTYDPDKGYFMSIDQSYIFKGIFTDVKDSAFENTLVDFHTRVCYLLPGQVNPTIGDKIEDASGNSFSILDIAFNKPNDVSFVWQLLVKA